MAGSRSRNDVSHADVGFDRDFAGIHDLFTRFGYQGGVHRIEEESESKMTFQSRCIALAVGLATSLASTGCPAENGAGGPASADALEGKVQIDGSSTVYPITEAVAEEFRAPQPKIALSIGISGTGGGFKKFVLGETDINDASRTIKDSEAEKCRAAGIEFIEIPVAYDGLSVVVNKDADWLDTITVAELNAIWKPESTVTKWSDVRDGWPDVELKLYGPGVDSGTFDYFTEAINGKSQRCRSDFTQSEDDNVLVQGVAGDRYALGFFGFAYYAENKDKIKLLKVDGGTGTGVAPSEKTINDGTYAPLSRPLFIYVSKKAADRPEVVAFVDFYLANAAELSADVGYVALPEKAYELAKTRFEKRITGSVFAHVEAGRDLLEVLGAGLAN